MALEHKDRVKDQSTTTGTGTLTIDGVAPTGFRTIVSAHTTGATVRYAIADATQANWEVGEGVWTASGTTLTRVTVYASSNSNSLVSFAAGTKTVFTGVTAADMQLSITGNYTLAVTLAGNSALTLPTSGTILNSTSVASKAFAMALLFGS